MRRLLCALALATLVLGGCAQPATGSGAPAQPPRITARGTGTVTSTPDTVTVVLGVQTRGPGAQQALTANSEQAQATIDALEAAGVAQPDLQTSRLEVVPTQNPETGEVTGYEVTNLITATLRDIAGAGAVLDAAGTAGGDAIRVQQVQFSVADEAEPRARARADAVRRAQQQARQLAEAAGVTLGAVRSITEVSPGQPVPDERDQARTAQAAVPIQPGTLELQVEVEVVHDIAG